MYFIPQRNAWYRAIADISATRRYLMTVCAAVLLLLGWAYGLYPYMNSLVMHDYAERTRLAQQEIELSLYQKKCSGQTCSLKSLKEQLATYAEKCTDDFSSTQLTMLTDQAAKAGIHITAYAQQSEIKKTWCTKHLATISFSASLDALNTFLEKIAQSHALIECNELSCGMAQDGLYNTTCALRFISL